MAITDINVTGYVFKDDGDPLEGATVELLETGTTTVEATYSGGTTAAGLWTFTETSLDTTYDVRTTSGTSKRLRMWADEITLKTVDVSQAKIRGVNGAVAPLYFFADRADDAGDAWRIQASASDTLAIGSDKASAGTIIDYLTITNGANAAASLTTILGKLTVGVDDTGADVKFFGATAGSYWLWDESADGVVQIGTLTVGVDDAGHDVKFFGDTASAYILWDTSADKLLTAGGAVVDIVKDKLLIGGTAVTTTAAELNVLDAVTAGTVSASLGVVVDSSKDIGSFRNVTLTGELDAATLDLSSSADIAGDLVLSGGADGALQFTNAGENSIKIPDNQASALIIEEADNAYITFVTTNGSEAITVAKATTFSSTIAAATGSTIGTTVITDDSIVMTPSSSDTVTIAAATHGILNVTTVDAAGTAADVNIDADGEIVIDAADAAGTIFKIAGTAQVNVIDGGIVPETTNDIDLGTSSLEFKDAWFDGTVTADAFAGPLTGNVTGNASGTAATVTGGTQASITTVANVVEVGALNAGSITSGFGTIDTGSSNITTTGTVSAEQLTTTDDLALSSSGAVINFNSGNITLTHADDELVLKSGAGNTLLGIDAAGSGESQLKFRNQGVNKFQLVLVPGSHISLYDHVGGNESFRMYENSDNLQMVSGDIDMNSAGGVLNVGASGNDWTATLLALQNTALLKIGATTAHGTTAGTNLISLFNGTAPAGTLTNGASFFCASGEMKVIDAAGNITVLSPHDDDGQWVFHSRDSTTGRVLHIKMEQLMRRLDEELGGGFIEEFIER